MPLPKSLLLSEDTVIFIVTCVYFYSFTLVVIICIHSLFRTVSVIILISIWASIYRIGYALSIHMNPWDVWHSEVLVVSAFYNCLTFSRILLNVYYIVIFTWVNFCLHTCHPKLVLKISIDNLLAREYHSNAKYPVAQSSCNNNHSSLLGTIVISRSSLGRTTPNRNMAELTLTPKLSEPTLTRNVENPTFTRMISEPPLTNNFPELTLPRQITEPPPTRYGAGPTLIH